MTGSLRWGILSLAVLFALGLLLLTRVDLEKGKTEKQRADSPEFF